MFRSLLTLTFTVLCLPTVSADPFRIQDVEKELQTFGAQNVDQAILFGQPSIRGHMNRFGFQVGLRGCSRLNHDEDLYCYEAAFKSCVQILPVYTREQLLEFSNTYNRSRRLGQTYVDSDQFLGTIMCVVTRSDYEYKDTKFTINDVYTWEQTIEDFRSFLVNEGVDLVDPSIL